MTNPAAYSNYSYDTIPGTVEEVGGGSRREQQHPEGREREYEEEVMSISVWRSWILVSRVFRCRAAQQSPLSHQRWYDCCK